MREAQKGSAIVAVLWVALLLSVILAGALATVRAEVRIAAARGERLKAYEAAASGLDIAAARVAVLGEDALQHLEPLDLNGYSVTVRRSDEAQKLDINLADEAALQGLFERLGARSEEATGFGARIADWKDADSLSRQNGAEANEYANESARIGNRAFASIDELADVKSMPRELLECALPAVTTLGTERTVYSEQMNNRPTETGALRAAHTGASLGTSAYARAAGSRISLSSIAISNARKRLRLHGLFRVTGRARSQAAAIARYKARPGKEPDNAQSSGESNEHSDEVNRLRTSCANRKSLHGMKK